MQKNELKLNKFKRKKQFQKKKFFESNVALKSSEKMFKKCLKNCARKWAKN